MIAMPLVRSSVFSRLVASHPSNAGHHQVHEDHARAHAAASVVALGIAVAWSPSAARALMLFLVSSTHAPRSRWRHPAERNVLIAALMRLFPVVINIAVGLTYVDESCSNSAATSRCRAPVDAATRAAPQFGARALEIHERLVSARAW